MADQRRLFARWSDLVDSAVAAPTPAGRRTHLRDDTLARHGVLDDFVAANERLQARQAVLAAAEDRRASWVPAALILALGLLFGAGAVAGYRARSAERRATSRRTGCRSRFGEAMQASDSQAEAHRLLKTHLERSIAGSTITVLNRNNSADRLEAEHADRRGSPLARGARGPPAVLHGGAAEPPLHARARRGRGARVRALRRRRRRHHLPAAARRRRGHRLGARRARRAPLDAADERPHRRSRSRRPRRCSPTCATSRSPRRAPPPTR